MIGTKTTKKETRSISKKKMLKLLKTHLPMISIRKKMLSKSRTKTKKMNRANQVKSKKTNKIKMKTKNKTAKWKRSSLMNREIKM